MPEPENHSVRLLHEFREEFRQYRSEFAAFRTSTDGRFEELTKLVAGEMVVGRYAAAGVEKRLDALEGRITALEKA